MENKDTAVKPKQPAYAPPRASAASVMIVLMVTLFAAACTLLLGLFWPAMGPALASVPLDLQGRRTEALYAYNGVTEALGELQEKLPEAIDLENLRGPDYHPMRLYAKVSGSMPTGAQIAEQQLSAIKLKKFPFNKFSACIDEYSAYAALDKAFGEALLPYYNEDTEQYENMEKEPIFSAIDEFVRTNPATPAWAVALYKNSLAEQLGEDTETRIAYFDGVVDSGQGVDIYFQVLGPMLRELERYDELLKIYDRKLAVDRNADEFLLGKGKAYIALGDIKAAKKTARAAKKYAGEYGVAEALQIEMLRLEKKYDDAAKLYNDYLSGVYVDENGQAYPYYETERQYAIVLILQGDYQQALETAFEAATLLPESGEFVMQAIHLVALTAELAGEKSIFEQYSMIVQSPATQAALDAQDRKAALEELFLTGKGDVI